MGTSMGYELVSGGTDNHLLLLDLHNRRIDGAKLEKVLDLAAITLNKNSVPGDTSALVPGGIRIGTPALTTRGFLEEDFVRVAELIDRGVQIALAAKAKDPAAKLKGYSDILDTDAGIQADMLALREEVEAFA